MSPYMKYLPATAPTGPVIRTSRTADHFYSVSTEKPIEIFNLKAGFGGIYGAVVVLQGTRSSATSNRKMDQSLQCTVRYDM